MTAGSRSLPRIKFRDPSGWGQGQRIIRSSTLVTSREEKDRQKEEKAHVQEPDVDSPRGFCKKVLSVSVVVFLRSLATSVTQAHQQVGQAKKTHTPAAATDPEIENLSNQPVKEASFWNGTNGRRENKWSIPANILLRCREPDVLDLVDCSATVNWLISVVSNTGNQRPLLGKGDDVDPRVRQPPALQSTNARMSAHMVSADLGDCDCSDRVGPEEHKLSAVLPLMIVEPAADNVAFYVDSKRNVLSLALTCQRICSVVLSRHFDHRIVKAKVFGIMGEGSPEFRTIPPEIINTNTDAKSTNDELEFPTQQGKLLVPAVARMCYVFKSFKWKAKKNEATAPHLAWKRHKLERVEHWEDGGSKIIILFRKGGKVKY
ncbi:hypothetical protein BDM02DRAFT_3263022 [Thelephora ganbajun]|uniref:Uncharacterized protein n=1 Tax=Thelephora ganbajun TaxID=370292 RepID=A0ACB6Z7P6_THEGA|nr:hypothetical protein BDM02DRAFT_3263022 [Thelephora ganbajun]